jgi:hypothetical protein
VQGTILSWNNFCYQGSLIICPLVLSAIYIKNHDAIYYFSSIFSVIGTILTVILACRKDCKTLGKVTNVPGEQKAEKAVEMEEKKPEETSNNMLAAEANLASIGGVVSTEAAKTEASNPVVVPITETPALAAAPVEAERKPIVP